MCVSPTMTRAFSPRISRQPSSAHPCKCAFIKQTGYPNKAIKLSAHILLVSCDTPHVPIIGTKKVSG